MSPARARVLALVAALALSSASGSVVAQEETSAPTAVSAAPSSEATLTPSGETGAELLAMVPVEIGGLPLTTTRFEASGVLANIESDAVLRDLADLAEAHDTELNRLAIAGGGGVDEASFVSIIGGRLPGVPAEALQEYLIGIVLGPIDPGLREPGTIAGHDVAIIRARADAGPEDTAIVLPVGEIVWLVIADANNIEVAIDTLATD